MRRWLLAAAAALAMTACAAAASDPYPGYVGATAEERAAVVRVVEDYYAKRTGAAARRDTTELFAAYPRLAQGGDLQNGINADVFLPERMRISRIREIAVELEDRAPIAVFVSGDSALAFVHGREIWHYEVSYPGMGEFLTRIDLRRGLSGWILERTDEHNPGEPWPPRTPRR